MKTHRNMSPIKKYREETGLSLREFGERFNPPYHKTTILQWERNGVPLVNVVEVEEVTGVSRFYLRPDFFDLSKIPEGYAR